MAKFKEFSGRMNHTDLCVIGIVTSHFNEGFKINCNNHLQFYHNNNYRCCIIAYHILKCMSITVIRTDSAKFSINEKNNGKYRFEAYDNVNKKEFVEYFNSTNQLRKLLKKYC